MFELHERHVAMVHAAQQPLHLNKGLCLLRLALAESPMGASPGPAAGTSQDAAARALAEATKALALDRAHFKALALRARALVALGRDDEAALAALDEAEAAAPNGSEKAAIAKLRRASRAALREADIKRKAVWGGKLLSPKSLSPPSSSSSSSSSPSSSPPSSPPSSSPQVKSNPRSWAWTVIIAVVAVASAQVFRLARPAWSPPLITLSSALRRPAPASPPLPTDLPLAPLPSAGVAPSGSGDRRRPEWMKGLFRQREPSAHHSKSSEKGSSEPPVASTAATTTAAPFSAQPASKEMEKGTTPKWIARFLKPRR
jgi:hypothetical protein